MTGPHLHELSMLLRILTLLFFLPWSVAAAERPVPIDLALVFLVDASGSIDAEETELQRRGYADALRHPRILNTINPVILAASPWPLLNSLPMAARVPAWSGPKSTEKKRPRHLGIRSSPCHILSAPAAMPWPTPSCIRLNQ